MNCHGSGEGLFFRRHVLLRKYSSSLGLEHPVWAWAGSDSAARKNRKKKHGWLKRRALECRGASSCFDSASCNGWGKIWWWYSWCKLARHALKIESLELTGFLSSNFGATAPLKCQSKPSTQASGKLTWDTRRSSQGMEPVIETLKSLKYSNLRILRLESTCHKSRQNSRVQPIRLQTRLRRWTALRPAFYLVSRHPPVLNHVICDSLGPAFKVKYSLVAFGGLKCLACFTCFGVN